MPHYVPPSHGPADLAQSGPPPAIDGKPWEPINAGQPWSLRVEGPNSFRFERRPGDRWAKDVSDNNSWQGQTKERTELDDPVRHGARDFTVSFSMMVEPGPPLGAPYVILGQMHRGGGGQDASRGAQPFSQQLLPRDVFRVVTAGGDDNRGQTVFTDRSFQRGRWYNFNYRIHEDPAQGAVIGYRDGAKIIDYHGPVGFNDPDGVYFRFGIYGPASTTPIAVHYRDVHVGSQAGNSDVLRPWMRSRAAGSASSPQSPGNDRGRDAD